MKRASLVLLLCACAGREPAPATASTSAPAVATTAAAPAPNAQPLFEFRSSSWLDLHLRLHYAATGRRPPPPAAPAPPSDPAWNDAVAYYRERFGERGGMGIIFDDELVTMTRQLSAIGSELELTGIDRELAGHLVLAGALVKGEWRAETERNRAWVAGLEPLLAEHGRALAAQLATVYQTAWPAGPIRVEVSCFAGPVGAFTLEDPPLVVISSCDPGYAADAALEMIFHESSHLLVGAVEKKLDAEAARSGRALPERFWHSLLFYTAGELTRRRLGDGYVPYVTKNDLGPVREVVPALEASWRPYLDGKVEIDAAIAALVAAVATGTPVNR